MSSELWRAQAAPLETHEEVCVPGGPPFQRSIVQVPGGPRFQRGTVEALNRFRPRGAGHGAPSFRSASSAAAKQA